MTVTFKFKYETLKDMPILVRSLVFNHSAWIVGGAAKFMCGLTSGLPKDWDLIVPPYEWVRASKLFPTGSCVNTMGGIKVINDGCVIDIWASDLGDHFLNSYGPYELLAVSPKNQQVCFCTNK